MAGGLWRGSPAPDDGDPVFDAFAALAPFDAEAEDEDDIETLVVGGEAG